MLPQSQNANFQPPEIASILPPALRVEPVFQPRRLQTQESAPTLSPIEKPYKPPSLDIIPLILKITKYKKIPQILKTRKTKAAPPA